MHSFFSNIYNISQLLHKIYGIPDIPDVDIQVDEYQYRIQWCSSKGRQFGDLASPLSYDFLKSVHRGS